MKTREKTGSIIVIVCVLVSILGIFCFVNRKPKQEQEKQAQYEDNADMTFVGANIELGEVKGVVCSYTQKKGILYILTKEAEVTEVTEGIEVAEEIDTTEEKETAEKTEEMDEIGCYHIYSMRMEDDTQCILTREEEKITFFCVDDDENVVYIAENEADDKRIIDIVKTDKTGDEVERMNLREITGRDNFDLCRILIGHDGEIVLAGKDTLFFLNDQLQVCGKVQPKQDVLVDIAMAKTGQLVCVTDQLNSDVISLKVSLLDPKKKQWGEDLAIPLDTNLQQDYIMDGMDYDFCYKGSSGIFGYDLASKESKGIINYNNSYMINDDADGMISVGGNRFVGKTEHYVDRVKQITLVYYEKKDGAAVTTKQKITFLTLYAGKNVKSAVAKFNRNHAECEIEIVEYSDIEYERLLADFASGKGQDIIAMDAFPLSVTQCVSKGMLEDLTPYFDSDAEISRDDLLKPVRKAMEYDGKMYYVAPGFSVQTIAAKKEDVGDCSGWSISDLKAFMDRSAKNKDLFPYTSEKQGCFELLTSRDFSDYVDWETGHCSFDSESFKYLLEVCNEKGLRQGSDEPMEDIWADADNLYSGFQNGEYLLMDEYAMDLPTIQFEQRAIKGGVSYVGCPNEARNGSLFKLDNRFAISAQSEHKEEAWEFIRSFLLTEYQRNLIGEGGIGMPIMQNMFDEKLKEMTATESYENEFGDVIEPVKEQFIEWGGIEVKTGVPTQEDIDIYMNLINHTKRCADYDSAIYDIMMEEISGYFDGRKKLDETVEVIQQRVTTYINEQK